MLKIIIPEYKDMPLCAQVYASAYSVMPWNESYEVSEVIEYIASYTASDTRFCFALQKNSKIIGIALGFIVPCIGKPYFRIEDFCISSDCQGNGFGSAFMDLLVVEAKRLGCDSILLGTQNGYPSHQFYLKNCFKEIETSLLLYRDI